MKACTKRENNAMAVPRQLPTERDGFHVLNQTKSGYNIATYALPGNALPSEYRVNQCLNCPLPNWGLIQPYLKLYLLLATKPQRPSRPSASLHCSLANIYWALPRPARVKPPPSHYRC